MTENAVMLMAVRDLCLNSARMLRRAAAEASPREKETQLDFERLKNTLEDLAEANLVKKASIEPAMEKIAADPTLLCDVIRNIGMMALEARQAAADKTLAASAEAPGTLVGKKASVVDRKSRPLSEMFAEASRAIEAKVGDRL